MREKYQQLLREINAASDLEGTLIQIVQGVKEAVPLDACAIYLADHDAEKYVLMASSGIGRYPGGPPRFDQRGGLLGLVTERRELVTLTHASTHPRFRPAHSTGDNRFETFVGMPLIHRERICGILAGWKMVACDFEPEELRFIVTLGTRLASWIYDLAAIDEVDLLLKGVPRQRDYIEGVQASPGLAVGIATVLQVPSGTERAEDRLDPDNDIHEAAFRTAVAAARRELELQERRLADTLPDEAGELLGVYRLLLNDQGLLADTVGHIRTGCGALEAWRETIRHHAGLFERMEDPYLRARADDVREVGQLVLVHLDSGPGGSPLYDERCILVGDRVGITDIAAVPAGQLAGIVCRHGSALSHTAVLAHALGIPAVVRLASLPVDLIQGCLIAVDGDLGHVYVRPSPTTVEEFRHTIRERQVRAAEFDALRGLPARTPDGVSVPLHANISLPSDTRAAIAAGAEGVGLFRTENQFLLNEGFPIEEEQYQCYLEVLKEFDPSPVTIRTLDIGGDKILSYFPVAEDNPFLGCRGIRFSLSHPEIFKIQLRALLRANAAHGNLRILFPMIARVAEVRAAFQLLAESHQELLQEGKVSAIPSIGVMVEVPSAVFLTGKLADCVDFLSIGSNDLTQYLLAADRTNAEVADSNDTLHPAVLHAIQQVIVQAHECGRAVSVCGEMAGDQAGALVLLGMGVDTLSMSPNAIGPVKHVIRSFSIRQARMLAQQSLKLEDGREVHQLLTNALQEAGIAASTRSADHVGTRR